MSCNDSNLSSNSKWVLYNSGISFLGFIARFSNKEQH